MISVTSSNAYPSNYTKHTHRRIGVSPPTPHELVHGSLIILCLDVDKPPFEVTETG